MFLQRQEEPKRKEFSGFFTKTLKKFLQTTVTPYPTTTIRPSEIHLCTRYIVGDLLGKVVKEPLTASSRKILDNGTYVHKRYLKKYIPAMGIAAKIFDKKTGTEKEFIDVSIENKDLWIKGAPDAVIIDPETGVPYVFELKSINSFSFTRLESPEEAHILQTYLYMYLTNIKQAIIFYESKDTQVTKEFSIVFSEEIMLKLLEKIRIIQQHVLQRTLPPCDNPTNCKCAVVQV